MAERDNGQAIESLPQGWRTESLGQAYDVILGQSPPSAAYNMIGDGLPFFQGKSEFGEIFPEVRKWCSNPTKIALENDVLISVRAPVGPTNLSPDTVGIGRGLAALRPKEGMPAKYLLYYLRFVEDAWDKLATGTTFKAITGPVLRNKRIPIPPVSEQQAIVAKIEELFTQLDAGVGALKRAQANLKRYKASVLKAACEGRLVPTEAELARAEGRDYEPASELLARILSERRAKWEADLRAKGKDAATAKYKEPTAPDNASLPELPEGWCWATVEQVAETIGGVTKGRNLAGKKTITVPYLRVANVQRWHLNLGEVKEIEVLESDLEKYCLLPGDVLLTEGGDFDKLGRSAIWKGEVENCIHQNHIFRARLYLGDMNSMWLALSTNSELGQKYFAEASKQTTNLASVNLTQLRACPVPLPPLAEQTRIIDMLSSSEILHQKVESELNDDSLRANRLRQSILKRAFEGRLVNTNKNYRPDAGAGKAN